MGLNDRNKFRTYGFFVYDDIVPSAGSMNESGKVNTDAVSKYVNMRASYLKKMESSGAIASAFSCGSDSDAGD